MDLKSFVFPSFFLSFFGRGGSRYGNFFLFFLSLFFFSFLHSFFIYLFIYYQVDLDFVMWSATKRREVRSISTTPPCLN